MGIKHLWTVLTPFCERRPLHELSGKTVAIDLSCWICEAQNIAEYEIQPRMYLRQVCFVFIDSFLQFTIIIVGICIFEHVICC